MAPETHPGWGIVVTGFGRLVTMGDRLAGRPLPVGVAAGTNESVAYSVCTRPDLGAGTRVPVLPMTATVLPWGSRDETASSVSSPAGRVHSGPDRSAHAGTARPMHLEGGRPGRCSPMPEAEYARTRRHLMWRWRSNPLRRHADVVEARVVVAVWAAVSLGGAFVGTLTADSIDQSFAERRAALHADQGVLLESTMDAVAMAEGPQRISVRAQVRWTTSDGATHTSRAWVDAGRKAGATVPVWTDGQGRLTREPPSAGEAAAESAFLGAGAAVAFSGLTYAAGRAVRWRLDRRRYDLWAREWEQVGPQWRRRTM